MEIYPAVDLYQGKVVRLERGDYEKCRVYSEEPLEVVERWIHEGARWIHIVDLEGARAGEIKNWPLLEQIAGKREVSIQFGGGVRNQETIRRLLELGIKRVLLGTKVLDFPFLKSIATHYGDRIGLSLDVRGERVQVEGWMREGKPTLFDLFRQLKPYPISCVIVTDIERDGTLGGMNLEKMKRILQVSPFPVIVSGGMASLEEVRSVASLGEDRLEGVIIGKALYEGRVKLSEALSIARGEEEI